MMTQEATMTGGATALESAVDKFCETAGRSPRIGYGEEPVRG